MGEYDDKQEWTSRVQTDIGRVYQDIMAPTRWVVMRHTHTWRPPTDVYETDEAIVVRVEVAGMREADFHVELAGRLLVISGARQDPCSKVAYHQLEIRYGEFRVEVYLHWPIDPEGIEAEYADGFLHVTLPRGAVRKIRPIETSLFR